MIATLNPTNAIVLLFNVHLSVLMMMVKAMTATAIPARTRLTEGRGNYEIENVHWIEVRPLEKYMYFKPHVLVYSYRKTIDRVNFLGQMVECRCRWVVSGSSFDPNYR
jgi:hypothetical protein